MMYVVYGLSYGSPCLTGLFETLEAATIAAQALTLDRVATTRFVAEHQRYGSVHIAELTLNEFPATYKDPVWNWHGQDRMIQEEPAQTGEAAPRWNWENAPEPAVIAATDEARQVQIEDRGFGHVNIDHRFVARAFRGETREQARERLNLPEQEPFVAVAHPQAVGDVFIADPANGAPIVQDFDENRNVVRRRLFIDGLFADTQPHEQERDTRLRVRAERARLAGHADVIQRDINRDDGTVAAVFVEGAFHNVLEGETAAQARVRVMGDLMNQRINAIAANVAPMPAVDVFPIAQF